MATQPIETADETENAEVQTEAQTEPQERDYEAEARHHGWTPKDEFKGDPDKWVDAETFVKRADEVMPFLKKQNAALKREIDDMKRDFKKASKHFSEAEERAYKRALADLERAHDEAVETGDVEASKRIRKEMADLKPQAEEVDDTPDPAQARKELDAWIAANDWYITDQTKREYADLQARIMGPANEWDGGSQAYLDELARRVEKRFADKPKKTEAVNGGGNRGAPGKGGKTFADLPPEAKKLCDKWVANGLIKDRETYVKSYQWD